MSSPVGVDILIRAAKGLEAGVLQQMTGAETFSSTGSIDVEMALHVVHEGCRCSTQGSAEGSMLLLEDLRNLLQEHRPAEERGMRDATLNHCMLMLRAAETTCVEPLLRAQIPTTFDTFDMISKEGRKQSTKEQRLSRHHRCHDGVYIFQTRDKAFVRSASCFVFPRFCMALEVNLATERLKSSIG